MRASPVAPWAGLLSAVGLVIICTIAQMLYAIADQQRNTPLIDQEFAGGFMVGGFGGAFFAFAIAMAILQ